MSDWLVTNRYKKSVETHEIWEKDGMAIRRIIVWRYGSWVVTTDDDNEPKFDFGSGPSGESVDMNYAAGDNNITNVEMDELIDGCSEDVIWPDDMPQKERDRLEELWDEEPYSSWEEEGWDNTDTECWVSDGFDVERVEE